MNIITMTLNPAWDVHISAEALVVGKDNPATLLRSDAGGKGINVSRALDVAGVENLCFLVLAAEDGESFLAPLRKMGVNFKYESVEGRVRVNYNVHTKDGETVIATQGPTIDSALLSKIEAEICAPLAEGDVLCFNGRLSPTTDKSSVIDMLIRLGQRGVRVILDSKSITLADIIAIKPFMVKPNKDELEDLFGVRITSDEELLRAMRVLSDGGVEQVLVSLGAKGAALLCDEGFFLAETPKIDVISAIGAGDSMIAGYICAINCGLPAEERLRRSVAFGSAACLSEGTMPPESSKIDELYELITVQPTAIL